MRMDFVSVLYGVAIFGMTVGLCYTVYTDDTIGFVSKLILAAFSVVMLFASYRMCRYGLIAHKKVQL